MKKLSIISSFLITASSLVLLPNSSLANNLSADSLGHSITVEPNAFDFSENSNNLNSLQSESALNKKQIGEENLVHCQDKFSPTESIHPQYEYEFVCSYPELEIELKLNPSLSRQLLR